MIHFGASYAKRIGAEFRVYTSKSHDPNKNPLPYQQKLLFLRQLFPGINIVDDPNATTAFAICRQLSDQGIEDVTMITGGDRVAEFQRSIGKYVMDKKNPHFDKTKNYAFKKFNVINSGERKAGISGTDMRKYIKAGKFDKFLTVSPTTNKALARRIFSAAKKNLAESLNEEKGMSRKDFHDKLMSFVDFTCDHLGIDERPTVQYKEDGKEGHQPSFASYSPSDKVVSILTKNRHPMDVFRSVAHELVHHKQNLDGRLGKDIRKEGSTGSKIENEANSEAGKIMRYFGAENPFYFDMQYVKENKAIILAGTPGSGKDKILKEAILPFRFTEVSADNFHASEMRDNLVVNGTSDYLTIKTIKEALELKGYDTIMVFVNTSNEVSKQRNEARALKGGRVITETVRFTKWKNAQESLDKFDALFEKVIEVKNDLDLNLNEDVIKETYDKLINSVSKEIADFALNEADRRFETMLNEVGGAGNWGTPQLTHRYQKDTPGQHVGFRNMKVLKMKNKNDKVRVYGKEPQFNDRIGTTTGSAKNPSFTGDTSGDNTFMPPEPVSVMRWAMSEETKKRFKERYGQLAEQKIKETAARLSRIESIEDFGTSGLMGMTPNSANRDDNDFGGAMQKAADKEKTSLFGKRKSLNKKRNK